MSRFFVVRKKDANLHWCVHKMGEHKLKTMRCEFAMQIALRYIVSRPSVWFAQLFASVVSTIAEACSETEHGEDSPVHQWRMPNTSNSRTFSPKQNFIEQCKKEEKN